jgi:hypothetical protein
MTGFWLEWFFLSRVALCALQLYSLTSCKRISPDIFSPPFVTGVLTTGIFCCRCKNTSLWDRILKILVPAVSDPLIDFRHSLKTKDSCCVNKFDIMSCLQLKEAYIKSCVFDFE